MTKPTGNERFVQLLEEHKRILYKVASAYCADTEDRRDLVQEMVIQLWRSFPRYDDQLKFSTWMYRIGMNVAISFLRSEGRRSRDTVALEQVDVIDYAAADRVMGEAGDDVRLLQRLVSRLVVTVQKELGKLRILRIRTTKWMMILSLVLWFPVLIVLLEGFLGVDMGLILGAVGDRDGSFVAWVVGNVLFGLAVALVMIWVSIRYADRADRSPAIKRLMDDFAGRSLTKALSSLDSIVRFETEPQGANGSHRQRT